MRALRLAVALAWLLAAGCVAIERQTTVLIYEPRGDELRVLTVFEGIHVSGEHDHDLEKAKKELKRFIQSGAEVCLGTCGLVSHISLVKPSETDAGEAARALTRRHFVIRNRAFFLNPEGRFSGWQEITVRDARKYLSALNIQISSFIASDLQGPQSWDEATARLFSAAVGGPFPWIGLDPGRISVTIPGSPEFFRKSKAEFLQQMLLKKEDPQSTPTAFARELKEIREFIDLLSETPFSVDQRHDRIVISVGYGAGAPIRMAIGTLAKGKGMHEDSLLEFARQLALPFLPPTSTEAIVAEFLRTGTADPGVIGAR